MALTDENGSAADAACSDHAAPRHCAAPAREAFVSNEPQPRQRERFKDDLRVLRWRGLLGERETNAEKRSARRMRRGEPRGA